MDFIARKIDNELYVSIDQVNRAIEEKNAEIEKIKDENNRLKKEVWEADERAIDAGATSVEKMEETKSTRRALWLARAERAKTTAKIYSQEASLILLKEHYPKSCGFCYIMNNKWKKVEQLCRAKAKDLK